MTQLIWFRRDLRLADNPALQAACDRGEPVVCVYVHAPSEEAPWQPGAASRWWLHHSLAALDGRLRKLGQRLILIRDASSNALTRIAIELGAVDVHVGALIEPAARARDRVVQSELAARGITLHRYSPNLLFEPASVAGTGGGPYRVFTPFWRKLRMRLESELRNANRLCPKIPGPPGSMPEGVSLATLGLLPRTAWDQGLAVDWRPGEEGAALALAEFLDGEVEHYPEVRNRPDLAGTSRLSPHLHFGEISPQQILAAIEDRGLLYRSESFVRELGWREFCHHLLWHFPESTDAPLDARFADYPWQEPPDAEQLGAWQQGRTGIPLVDAGMRELWHTGWMHNRVRMVVASFLTKNLRIHWLHGARWFWDTLVDADLANNSAGWQWTAGSGADAAPYFRIFNPVLQGRRFDPRGDYVRRWIPELARVPTAAIHSPWTLSASELQSCGISDSVYAHPRVDLAASREAALAGFMRLRAAQRPAGPARRPDR